MRHHNSIGFLLGFDRPTSESPKSLQRQVHLNCDAPYNSLKYEHVTRGVSLVQAGARPLSDLIQFDLYGFFPNSNPSPS